MPDVPVAPDLQPPLPRFWIDHGWCPHQVEKLESNFDEDVLSYLNQLDWSRAQDLSHERCRKEEREESQDESTSQKNKASQDRTVLPVNCKAFQIDDEYEPKHTTPDCKCDFVHVDREELAGIIDDGGVPLISIEEHDSGGISLKVEARSVHSRYTAISHVWRDGLGNESRNALPKCQLQQLNACLKNMPKPKESGWRKITPWTYGDWRRQNYSRDPCPPPLFWLDTLCIPVGPKGSEGGRLRAEAMRDMALIYSSPVQVLVLDAELQMCSTENKDAIELVARIVCSSWMTRAWTLVEGVLAREVVFQFKDMAVDPLGSWSPLGEDPKFSTSIRFPKGERYRKIYKALFGCLWNELRQGWKHHVTPRTYGSASISFPTARASPNEPILTESNDLEVYRVNQLVDAWNELAFRTTTRPDDIPVILSSLLDFKFDPLPKECPVEDFMDAVIFSFDTLPGEDINYSSMEIATKRGFSTTA
ncbi:Het domain-containing protein [Lasiodiplodia theobromae]|uniref:Het domain-containing protein n=1 Tax=Lasiodiplodia theobromae TaxID=45133 RepID=UPI0015C3391C|nr:Het domain-containing protein [Lasiodiplodia theobromae]KAF4536425.1 Het domain-containing protein [Lasiodiplodia theobromae]